MTSPGLAALFAVLTVPVGTMPSSSAPLPSSSPLKTIVTVKSTPFCTALAQHFNAALVPMLANDRVFDAVGVQLTQLNDVFTYPDYANRFIDLRNRLRQEAATLTGSLRPMQAQIDQLREAAALSADAQAVQQMRDAASRLQDAYKHQFQLATDLQGLAHAMMEYDVMRGDHPLNGWTPDEQSMPQESKDIKSYVDFDAQQTRIAGAESSAVDVAYALATSRCAAP